MERMEWNEKNGKEWNGMIGWNGMLWSGVMEWNEIGGLD